MARRRWTRRPGVAACVCLAVGGAPALADEGTRQYVGGEVVAGGWADGTPVPE